MSIPIDRSLLLGCLALQLDFVKRDQLVQGMKTWMRNTSEPLDSVLTQLGALECDTRQLLNGLVDKYVAAHDGDVEQSITALSHHDSVPELLESLQETADDVKPPFASDTSQTTMAAGPLTNEFTVQSSIEQERRFRRIRPHAKGGLGLVSVAWDEELKREVALKEIRPEYVDQPESQTRFIREAKITGGLEHPGIVPVYSLGQFTDRPPYYAMRFIRGETLREAVKCFHQDHRSNPRDRVLEMRKLLGRFIDVCQAMEYAHSRGVIHRDLKPANIMLGKYGETLVVDWGLAKATDRVGGESVACENSWRRVAANDAPGTGMGSAVGTPSFMSPEQAAGLNESLDCRSDVYSLGATLYYILTGQPPFVGNDTAEILRQAIVGSYPFPRELTPSIPKALEKICLKAMEKEPDDRYATAQALADDIDCFLADEPVDAFLEPLRVTAARWLRKHPAMTSAATIAAFLMLVFLSVGFVTVTSFNHKLETALLRSETNFDIARTAVSDYLSAVTTSRKLNQTDFSDLRIELLETALPFFNRLLNDSPNDLETLDSRATANLRLASIYSETGKLQASREQAELAAKGFQELCRKFPASHEHAEGLATSHTVLGVTLSRQGELRQSKNAFFRSLEINEKLLKQFPDESKLRRETAAAHNNLGTAWVRLGQPDQARDEFRGALTCFEELIVLNSNDHSARRDLAAGHTNLGTALVDLGKREAALSEFEIARELMQELTDETSDRDYRRELANIHGLLGTSKRRIGKMKESRAHHEECEALMQQLIDEFPSYPEYCEGLAGAKSMMARLNSEAADFETAETQFEDSISMYEELFAEFGGTPKYGDELARVHMNYSMMLGNLSNDKLAREHAKKALKIRTQLVTDFPQITKLKKELALCHTALGVTHAEQQEWDAAALEFEQAVAQYEKLKQMQAADPDLLNNMAGTISNLGLMRREQNDLPEAKRNYLAAIEIRENLVATTDDPAQRIALAEVRHNLALLLVQLKDYPTAEIHMTEALSISKNLWEQQQNRVDYILRYAAITSDFGHYQTLVTDPEDGLPLFSEAIELLTPIVVQLPQHRYAREHLRRAYTYRAEAFEALENYKEAASAWLHAADHAASEQQSNEYNEKSKAARAKTVADN